MILNIGDKLSFDGKQMITVAAGKLVGIGDYVWIWIRASYSTCLVRKKVTSILASGVSTMYDDNPYNDVLFAPSACYATKKDATESPHATSYVGYNENTGRNDGLCYYLDDNKQVYTAPGRPNKKYLN